MTNNYFNAKSSDFVFGQICAYEVKWPEEAVDNDVIVLKADTLAEGALIYVASGVDGLTSTIASDE